ncbi:hypothetical protein ES705_32146 [subsurface metagenome]
MLPVSSLHPNIIRILLLKSTFKSFNNFNAYKTDNSKIILKKRDEKKPLYVPEDHFMIKILSKVYEEVTGTKAELLSIGGGTYARALDNMVAFGPLFPGRQILAHQKNEFLYLEDIVKMTKVYVKAIKVLVE